MKCCKQVSVALLRPALQLPGIQVYLFTRLGLALRGWKFGSVGSSPPVCTMVYSTNLLTSTAYPGLRLGHEYKLSYLLILLLWEIN